MSAEEARPIEDVDSEAESADDAVSDRSPRRRLPRLRVDVGPALWVLAIVASVALLVALTYSQLLPDRRTNEAAGASAMSAASDGMTAVLSYSWDTMQKDFSTAKSHLTSDFTAQYDQYIRQAVGPYAQQKGMKTSAVVTKKALSGLQPDSAQVLLFINQTTTSLENPAPVQTASSVMVNLSKVDGKWLISSFNPA